MLDTELNKFHLDEFQTVRIKITILLTFIISLIAVILSYSIYLSYENQKLVEIEDDIKLKLIQVIDAIDKDISQIFKLSMEENTFICLYNLTDYQKLCINNLNNFHIEKKSINPENIKIFEGRNQSGSLILYGYKYKSQKEYFIVIGKDESYLKNDLEKLKKSIFYSIALVIMLSGFLAYSVSGRLLEPIKKNKENLENVLNIISHDLRTPITIIKTNFYLMKAKKFHNIENNINQIEKNLDYIQNILANVEALKSVDKKEIEEININHLVKDVLAKFENKIQEKNLRIVFSEKDQINIIANYVDMEVCFSNLIENAIKYNEKNGIIEVEFDKSKIKIKNTGKSINKPEKIFEKFYREDSAGTTEGLGLGLSIVKKICEKYGFKISYSFRDNMNNFIIKFR
ncbi:sensor histidine kinase [Sulfurihydrogenibium yellowstonense]|uniref:sensor histidine kinase n=1 Tax=Sulfurihydrogenibium yellowstonense TaxID=304736 RepID=UPI001E5AD9E2|nr:HAMP domain-containing sensor histidine kinase [Sulfurihydrogenibium yellowstonense]